MKLTKQICIYCLVCLLSCTSTWGQVIEKISPPEGYVRTSSDKQTFTTYLRQLPLFPKGTKVKLYNGQEKRNQAPTFAVVDMEIGKRDLQQCADAVIRLRAEYLWAQKKYEAIKFNFTNGFRADYKNWAEGKRIKVTGNKVQWYTSTAGKDYSYKTFRNYLDMVFMYAGTASLSRELVTVSYNSLQPGDVFIQGGYPGHAVIVIDVAVNQAGKKVFLLAQSYMPAQQIHVLVNPTQSKLSPWYELTASDNGKLYTPEWTFDKKDLKRFK